MRQVVSHLLPACSLAAVFACLPAAAAQAAPAVVSTTYQPPVVGIYHPDGNALWRELDAALRDTGRVSLVSPAAPSADGFLQAMRGLAGRPEGAYAIVPSLQIGRLDVSAPRSERSERSGGGYDGKVSVDVYCPYTLALVVYDAATGRVLDRVTRQDAARAPLTYTFTEKTSADEVHAQTQYLLQRAKVESTQSPEQFFGDALRSVIEQAMVHAADDLADLPLFRLQVTVAGWDTARDRIAFNLGRDMRVRFDDGFRVMLGGRQIGYVKVRELGDRASSAQPLYMTGTIDRSARIVEDDKRGHHFGLRTLGGLLPMTAGVPVPVGGAGVGYEVDVAPLIPISELYLTGSANGLYGATGPGALVDLGFAKKVFFRQLAVRLSARGAVLACGGGPSAGGLAGLGLEHHVNEHLHASLEVEGAWLLNARYDSAGAQLQLGNAWSLSPLGRLGLTWVF